MNLNDLQKQLENDVKQAAITTRINKNNKNIKNKNELENWQSKGADPDLIKEIYDLQDRLQPYLKKVE